MRPVLGFVFGLFVLLFHGSSPASAATYTVRSVLGNPEACALDCQGSAPEPHRAVHFHSGEGVGAVLFGVTIRNG